MKKYFSEHYDSISDIVPDERYLEMEREISDLESDILRSADKDTAEKIGKVLYRKMDQTEILCLHAYMIGARDAETICNDRMPADRTDEPVPLTENEESGEQ